MKKILSMFLALCMVVTLLPVTAMAEEIHTPIGTSGEITNFAPLTETEKTRALGTSIQDLELPETLTATVRTAVPIGADAVQDSGSPETATPTTATEPEWEETTMDIPVKWESTPEYDMDTEGEYVFTPVIEGYTVKAELPEITVTVGEAVMGDWLAGTLSATTYDIWVGGVQVTDVNKDNITGTGISGTVVAYDPTSSTLTLNNATITGAYEGPKIYSDIISHYGIYAATVHLNIVLEGSNTVIGKSASDIYSAGIYTSNALTLSGSGSLSVSGGTGKFSVGIQSMGNLTISSGTVTATSAEADLTSIAIFSGGVVTIFDGAVEASANTATSTSYGMIAANGYTINGGTVTANTNKNGDGADMYNAANLATYKYLKVEPAAGVSEQFNLTPGGTYYFDLSGEKDNIGMVRTALPDTTLHYVPFTYAGTVNAYSLTSAMATTEEYATANKSDRSLFVGDYNIGTSISWNSLNTANLIYGKTFDTNYTLRSLSVGSSKTGSALGGSDNIGQPNTNEWDQILTKSGSTNNTTGWIKDWNSMLSWGQDTSAAVELSRAYRGGLVQQWDHSPSSSVYPNLGFRPALEVLNPGTLGSGGLKAVTLNLNGGSLKGSIADINIICAGGSFKAPSGEGVTAPVGKTFGGWKDTISTTTYDAGVTVPNTVTGLTAQWEALYTDVAITSVYTTTTNGTYTMGDTLSFTVIFNENVIVTGEPSLSLTIGSETKQAAYVSGSGTQVLSFCYAVQAGDSDPDGISVGASLNANGGTIKDSAGNNATLTFSPPATTGVLVDALAPIITGEPSPQTVNVGQGVTFSVTATGTGLTYRWQVNTGSSFEYITNGGVYSGANTSTLTITGATAEMNGYQYHAVVSDIHALVATSNTATLTVNAVPAKTVSVGSQSGTATAGTAGSLTYTVTTANIANGKYAVSVANLPAGVTVGSGGNVTVSGNSGTLTLTVADTAAAGTTGTLALTLDGTTSAAFSIVIGETVPNLSVADVTLDAVTVGYMSSAYRSIVIANSGDAMATISNVTTDHPSVFSTHSGHAFVAAGSSINSWQIRAATGLTVGTYTATITVTYDGGRTATATVSITVNAVGNHTVTFNPNGGTVGETSRSVASGTAVGTLPIPTRFGSYSFDGWYTAASGGTQISVSTTVSANVTYYAHWTYTGGGGGNGGGSSSNDNSSPVIVTPPAPDKPNSPTQGEIKVPGTEDSKGNITVNITDKTVSDAFDKALAYSKKNGNEQNGITVVLRVDTSSKTGSNVTVNLPKTVQDTIIAKKIVNTIVVVDNPDIRIGMDLTTVQEINKQAKSDVNITATRTDSGKLTGEAKKAIGSRPAFNLKVNYGSGNAVSSFGAGSVSVTIPYTLGANEKAGNVQAVYVDSYGQVHWLTNSVYDSVAQVLRFATSHFSTYGIGYKQSNTAFMDIADHWAKEDIEFVVSRGLFSGTSTTTFSPNTAMTRGMFVTVLGRLANADVSGYTRSSFTDVESGAYYMGYIEWASKNSIVNGTGNGKFAPDQSITREQMAVIMSNYAKAIGLTLPKIHVEKTFADSSKISAYAKDAVKQMQMAGVINGKNGNVFDPQGTATRAEVSAVLRRFVELAISSDT